MNSKIKGIIVGMATLGLLGGTLVLLKNSPEPEISSVSENEVTTDTQENFSAMYDEQKNIVEINVKNPNGGFTMLRDNSGQPYIKELDGISEDSLDRLLNVACKISMEELVEENPDNLSKYGFDNPNADVSINLKDGTASKLLVGSLSPEKGHYYMLFENNVYLVEEDSIRIFMNSYLSFADLTLLSAPDNQDDYSFDSLTVKRADWDYECRFENDSEQNKDNGIVSAQVMTQPIFSYLNVAVSTNVTHGFWGLTADEAILANPTQQNLAEYGLDNPFCTVDFAAEGKEYTLNIGNKEQDGYFCTFEGVQGKNCIYKIDASKLKWADFQPSELLIGLMTWNFIYDVSEINISCPDEGIDAKFLLEGDHNAQTFNSVSFENNKLDTENFKNFYQYLISCPTDEIYFSEPKQTEPYLTIEIKAADKIDKIEFFKETDRRFAVKLNSRTSYIVSSAWVERFIQNTDAAEKNKNIISTY